MAEVANLLVGTLYIVLVDTLYENHTLKVKKTENAFKSLFSRENFI